uniref:Uncharacterized protein n=1 Tax=Pyrodinium bahamense TaxID=73915 RepID=A0A7S0B6A1_9DINO
MEAALKFATEAFSAAGQFEGEKALKAAVTSLYLRNIPGGEAAKAASEALTAAKKIGKKPEEFVLPTPKADAEAEKLLKAMSRPTESTAGEATQAAKDVLALFRKSGDKEGEAAALNLLANAYLVGGEPATAVKTARMALSIFLEKDNKLAELPILETLMDANLVKKDVDEAMRAAKEIVKITMFLGKKKSAAFALLAVADVTLASGKPGGAVKAAEESAEMFKAEGDTDGQAAAFSTIYRVHRTMSKPASAKKAAQQALQLVKGNKQAEAAASLMVADSQPASKDSLEAAKTAVGLFKGNGDRGGEACAMVALACAYISQAQKQFDEGLTAAQGALNIFKEKGDKAGQALAASTVAMAHMLKEDPPETEKAAKEALAIARESTDSIVEAYANSLLGSCPFVGVVQTPARLLFEENGVALVECSELSTQDSLEAVVQTLHNWSTRGKGVKAVAVHIEGRPCPVSMQCHAVRSGAFLLGLRSAGFPIIGSCVGTISGPSWGMFLATDYRVASLDTVFMCPIWGPPECLPDLVGQATATHLCFSAGPMSALAMLEMSVINQAHKDKESAQRSAMEFAKRVAAFPGIASRQTMCLMSPDVEKYALSFSQWGK